jgi:hypothetical protein
MLRRVGWGMLTDVSKDGSTIVFYFKQSENRNVTNIYQYIRLIIPEGLNFLQHGCKDLKSHNNKFYIQFNYTYASGSPILNIILKLVRRVASNLKFMNVLSVGQCL